MIQAVMGKCTCIAKDDQDVVYLGLTPIVDSKNKEGDQYYCKECNHYWIEV